FDDLGRDDEPLLQRRRARRRRSEDYRPQQVRPGRRRRLESFAPGNNPLSSTLFIRTVTSADRFRRPKPRVSPRRGGYGSYSKWRPSGHRQPLAGGRCGDGSTDAALLSRHDARAPRAGSGAESRATGDAREERSSSALLLGGVRAARRLAGIKEVRL